MLPCDVVVRDAGDGQTEVAAIDPDAGDRQPGAQAGRAGRPVETRSGSRACVSALQWASVPLIPDVVHK